MSGAEILTIVIMIVGFIGMIVSAKIQKTNPNAKLLAFICLIVVLGCAVKFVIDQGIFGGESREMKEQRDSYARFREAGAKKLGEYLAKKYAGKKYAVIAPNGTKFNAEGQDLTLQNLFKDKYLQGSSVQIMGLPYTPASNSDGIDESFNPKHFNKLFAEQKNFDLFIFTVPLPFEKRDVGRLTIWNQSPVKTRIALMDASVNYLGLQIQKGIIAAAVVQRPDLTQKDFEALAPDDLDKAFEARYVLITPENLKEVAKKYPALFQ